MFWHSFFDGVGSSRRRVASLEVPVKKVASGPKLARLKLLFGLYQQLATPLLPAPKARRGRSAAG